MADSLRDQGQPEIYDCADQLQMTKRLWTCVEHEHAVHIHFCTIPSPYALLRLTVVLCKEHSLLINLTPPN